MLARIIGAGNSAGADRECGAIGLREPAFGQAHREHKVVKGFEHLPHSSQVLRTVMVQFSFAPEPTGLDGGSEWVIPALFVGIGPGVLGGRESAVSQVEELYQLPGRINIAGTGRKCVVGDRKSTRLKFSN